MVNMFEQMILNEIKVVMTDLIRLLGGTTHEVRVNDDAKEVKFIVFKDNEVLEVYNSLFDASIRLLQLRGRITNE